MGWYSDTVKNKPPSKKEDDFITRFMDSMPKEQPKNTAPYGPFKSTPFKGLNIPRPLNTISMFKPLPNPVPMVKKPQAGLRARTAADENSTPYVDRHIGESYFNAQTFPVKAGDVSPLGIVKDLGNVVTGSLGIPGEALRRFSLTAGGKDPSKLPRQTSFVEDITPKGTGEQLGRFERFAHLPNGLTRTAIEMAADPVSWAGGGEVKAGLKATEELGSTMARQTKLLNKLNKGKTAVEKVATVAQDTLKPINQATQPFNQVKVSTMRVPRQGIPIETTVNKVSTPIKGGKTVVKEPWQMTKSEYMKKNPIPDMNDRIPESGNYPVVEMEDGSLFVDKSTDPTTHIEFIKKNNLPPERIKSGGWMKDGVYEPTGYSDTQRYADQFKAKKNVEHRILVDNAVKEGKPVPSKVLEEYGISRQLTPSTTIQKGLLPQNGVLETQTVVDKGVGYHKGDLGKGESFGSQYGSNRGTGHFGTGTYFVGENKGGDFKRFGVENNRPVQTVDFNGYKLYTPLNSDGMDLHDTLKAINSIYPDSMNGKVGFKGTNYTEDFFVNDILPMKLKYNKGEILKNKDMSSAYYATKKYIEEASKLPNTAQYNMDSASTYFMKQLGFDGIDVRHIPSLDNTGYGSVIYDLKKPALRTSSTTIQKGLLPQRGSMQVGEPILSSRTLTPRGLKPRSNINTLGQELKAQTGLKPILKNTLLPDPQSKIILSSKAPKKSFNEAWNNFYTRVVDTSNPGKRVGEEFYTKATNSKSVGGIVDNNLTASLTDVNGNKVGDSLKQVAEQIPKGEKEEKDFWTYMSQRHNIDRAREGKPVQPNYTPGMSVEAVRRHELANPGYKQTGDNITKWIDDFMQTWGVDTGIVNNDIYTDLRKTYKSYFPTQRDFSTLENAIPNGMSSKFVDLSSPIRKASGSGRGIKNPLENIMNLVNRTVRTAKYNEVGKSLLDSVRKAPDKLSSLAEEIPTKDGMFSKLSNVVTVLENGKPTYLQINDKPLLDMLNGLPKSTANIKILGKVTSGFKSLITQKNPVFAIRNIARDVPTYLVNGTEKNPLKALGNLGGAVKDIVTNSSNLQRYKGLGGGGANFFNSGNVSKSAAELTGRGNLLKKIVGAPIRGIEKFNNLTETAPRLAEFNSVLKKTGSTDKALFAANDVTVNFSRGGDITKALDRNGIPYLNAGIQGLDKLKRQFQYRPISTILKGATTITAPTLILNQINKNNPKYQQMDNRTKDNYYLIPNGDTFIKIPKSRELGVLFSSLIERTLRGDFKGFGSTVATNFAPTNPVENNIAGPIAINLKSNKDFAGRAIVPLGMVMDKRSPKLQYDETTSEIAKKIGELTNLSPKQIDYVIRSYTGVIGQLGLPSTVKQNYQGGNTFQKLLKPLTTQFTADPLYSNNVLNDFYTNMDKLSQRATDRNITEKLPSKLVTSEEAIRNKFTKASTQISDINKLIKKETDVNKVRELKQKILDIAKGTNLVLK